MSVLTVRDVPEDQIRVLKTRAAQAGKSLQAYMQELIARETTKPTMADMAAQLEREAAAEYTTADVLAAIDEGRGGR
ncbi:FitA-like ribbon-helix-helix domain-containing protein [Streptomyces pseudovenezuelae]|uniref:Plasmid stability protein n=1 Tax=Streptomyces pseudovenezuelae TaxID=67350 RepID=A0ABT6M2U6_9ACTN|nr:antitoxin [Streptomyces pseudovenezuelae]MDH6222875.1 plasmid stability protein [Streptomyces pseudovenezuelae]